MNSRRIQEYQSLGTWTCAAGVDAIGLWGGCACDGKWGYREWKRSNDRRRGNELGMEERRLRPGGRDRGEVAEWLLEGKRDGEM